MSIGIGLLRQLIIDNRSFSFLNESGLKRDDFRGEDELKIYDFIEQHLAHHGQLPQIQTVEQETGISLDNFSNEPLGYWVDAVEERAHISLIVAGIDTARIAITTGEVSDARKAIQELAAALGDDPEHGEPPESDPLAFPAEVMTGLAGDFARLYSSYLESPPEFFFMSFLTCLGAMIGDRLTLESEIAPQPRLFTVLLGESADARKSTAINKTLEFFCAAQGEPSESEDSANDTLELDDLIGPRLHVCRGVGSAEGLQRVLNKDAQTLLVLDELRQLTGKANIQNSVLLPCLTTLFESNEYANATRKSHINLVDVHLSILAASTLETFDQIWRSAFTAIGLNNRLFIVPGAGCRRFAVPRTIPEEAKAGLRCQLSSRLSQFQNQRLAMTPEALEVFEHWYLGMPATVHAKRIDTYALRLLPLLALSDGVEEIDADLTAKAIRLADWQLVVRQAHDPIDADSAMAQMEERIRRSLRGGVPKTEGQIRKETNAHRAGLWFFETALKNLSRAGEIRKNGKSRWALL